MGTSRWINNYVKEFPIPMVAYEQQTGIIKIVNQILEMKLRIRMQILLIWSKRLMNACMPCII